jgi:hypothetical protein
MPALVSNGVVRLADASVSLRRRYDEAESALARLRATTPRVAALDSTSP